ncbi:hypothetical protein [Nocardia veterana]|uniref:Uncharacterized protein n=1 Tax=Nocardia veterana TaxID=132249 RepID=A0A7X6LZN7_9NOCA|nr:hypothetical protein [Nocardia veterana]NKY87136.1 hypothetical protein [Nocardia veterana]
MQHLGIERPRQFAAEVSERFGDDAVEVLQHGVRGTDLVEEIFSDGRPCGVIVTDVKQPANAVVSDSQRQIAST